MRHPAFLLRVAAVTAVLLSGCTQPKFPLRTYAMGEKVTLGHLIYTVFETQWLNQVGTTPDVRIPQNRFFLVRINASNAGGMDIIVPNLSVVDDKGTEYPELDHGDGIPQWIGYLRSVHPAEAVAGNLVFDCPPGHYKLKVVDEDGERPAMIDIPLSFTNETPELAIPAADGKKKSEGDGHTLLPGRN
jgi:hypothetical protein